MDAQTLRRALDLYSLEPKEFLPIEKGYRNHSHPIKLTDGSICNLILYKAEPDSLERIKRTNAISDFLASKGLPARHTIDDRIIKVRAPRVLKYAALYNYLPGHTIPWEAYTMLHIKQLGKTMSNIHAGLQNFPIDNLPRVNDEYATILRQMQIYFADPNVANALKNKLNVAIKSRRLTWLEALVRLSYAPNRHQALHMDLVRSNVLFAQGSDDKPYITGILDFEKTAAGDPLFDLARTLAFLLVDCKYKTERQIRKYFLHSGYNKRGRTTWHDRRIRTRTGTSSLLEALLDLFLLHDFYNFLRHNPYEYLEQNEHFMRTKQQLLARSLIVAFGPSE